jgi:hypothetical protein
MLKGYWDFARGERNFPYQDDIKPHHLESVWDKFFIVKADNSCISSDDYKYIYLGEKVIKAFGEDLTNMTIEKMQAPEASHLAQRYEKVLASKVLVYDSGSLSLINGEKVFYRQILLPLGDNGITIKAILGGISHKIS